MNRLRLALLAATFATLPPPVAADDGPPAGSVAGTLRDAEGRALPGVEVTMEHQSSAVVSVRTDSEGRFCLPTLAPGVYCLRATLFGFVPLERTIPVDGCRRIDVADVLRIEVVHIDIRQRCGDPWSAGSRAGRSDTFLILPGELVGNIPR